MLQSSWFGERNSRKLIHSLTEQMGRKTKGIEVGIEFG